MITCLNHMSISFINKIASGEIFFGVKVSIELFKYINNGSIEDYRITGLQDYRKYLHHIFFEPRWLMEQMSEIDENGTQIWGFWDSLPDIWYESIFYFVYDFVSIRSFLTLFERYLGFREFHRTEFWWKFNANHTSPNSTFRNISQISVLIEIGSFSKQFIFRNSIEFWL